jgi:type II secretory pathway pseudopilin PulG
MMVVMTIIAIMAGAVYPSVASSLDGIRLNSTAGEVVAFLNGAVERANRRQVPVEIIVDKVAGTIVLHSTEAGWERRYDLPQGVVIQGIFPELPASSGSPRPIRQFLVYPGGSAPRVGVLIANRTGVQRLIRIDPITGSPRVERRQGDAAPPDE